MLSAALKEIKTVFDALNIEKEKGFFIGKKYFAHDIYLETKDGEKIGFEILARPSQKKMKQKLVYLNNLDKFIFILPSNFLQLYTKQPKYSLSILKPHFMENCFYLDNLYVWIYDISEHKIIKADLFCKVFNVKNS